MSLSIFEITILILIMACATIITRFLPFLILKYQNNENPFIIYLGNVLPYAAIGLLVVYCFKDTNFSLPIFGLPEIISAIFTALIHYKFNNSLLSICSGTILYMCFVQYIFK